MEWSPYLGLVSSPFVYGFIYATLNELYWRFYIIDLHIQVYVRLADSFYMQIDGLKLYDIIHPV